MWKIHKLDFDLYSIRSIYFLEYKYLSIELIKFLIVDSFFT